MNLKIRYKSAEAGSIDLESLCLSIDITDLIKNDKTTTLSKVQSDIGELVIKRYNTKNIWHGIRRNFQKSRASNCLRMSRIFNSVGINVAEPIAVVESKKGIFSGRSWFISRYVPGTMLIDCIDDDIDMQDLENISNKIFEIFSLLKTNKLSHGDMKATNLLVTDNSLVAIDLDAAKLHSVDGFHQSALYRDKARFLKNWNSNLPVKNHFINLFEALEI